MDEDVVGLITMRLRRGPVGLVIRMTSTLDVAFPESEQIHTFTSVDELCSAVREFIAAFPACYS
jgi:hypothetical protein